MSCLKVVLFAALVTLCAAGDADGDGVIDSRDFCPRTPKTLRHNDYFDNTSGCAQSQVDVDLDSICNPSLPALNGVTLRTSLCRDVDNCPFVYNPLQTDSFGNGVGDACNRGACAPADVRCVSQFPRLLRNLPTRAGSCRPCQVTLSLGLRYSSPLGACLVPLTVWGHCGRGPCCGQRIRVGDCRRPRATFCQTLVPGGQHTPPR
jgi:hypothetical protein